MQRQHSAKTYYWCWYCWRSPVLDSTQQSPGSGVCKKQLWRWWQHWWWQHYRWWRWNYINLFSGEIHKERNCQLAKMDQTVGTYQVKLNVFLFRNICPKSSKVFLFWRNAYQSDFFWLGHLFFNLVKFVQYIIFHVQDRKQCSACRYTKCLT